MLVVQINDESTFVWCVLGFARVDDDRPLIHRNVNFKKVTSLVAISIFMTDPESSY